LVKSSLFFVKEGSSNLLSWARILNMNFMGLRNTCF
jgi:hypothetical protein